MDRHAGTFGLPVPADRTSQFGHGKARRTGLPRSAQAEFTPHSGRDPIGVLRAQNARRLPELLALRRERMSESPFAFFRGAAAVMADDLAHGEDSGRPIVICGDAHLANFGLFAGRDRDLVFDLNDFDEAGVGPWEWDLKRLVTSVVILAQQHGMDDAQVVRVATDTARAYRQTIGELAQRSVLERYYSRILAATVIRQIARADKGIAKSARKVARKAVRNTSQRALDKLAAQREDGGWQIVDQPPLTQRLPDFDGAVMVQLTLQYARSVPGDVNAVLAQLVPQDGVLKVVGVGSVGTRCGLVLLTDPDDAPLFLQLKEATTSVVEQSTRRLPWLTPGQRVVAGQQILQASGDPFLGAFQAPAGRSYYVRQYRDMKGGVEPSALTDPDLLGRYGDLCGRSLARGHAQSGFAATIAGYLGDGDGRNVADHAFADFGLAYSQQNHADHQALLNATDEQWHPVDRRPATAASVAAPEDVAAEK